MNKTKDVVTPKSALAIWESLFEKEETKFTPNLRYVYRYLYRYEGILGYKTSNGVWWVYEDLWRYYLHHGFPDIATMQPVMCIPDALRYLHTIGIPSTYKLREFRQDATELGYVFTQKITKNRKLITRSNCHKFLAVWNGNR